MMVRVVVNGGGNVACAYISAHARLPNFTLLGCGSVDVQYLTRRDTWTSKDRYTR